MRKNGKGPGERPFSEEMNEDFTGTIIHHGHAHIFRVIASKRRPCSIRFSRRHPIVFKHLARRRERRHTAINPQWAHSKPDAGQQHNAQYNPWAEDVPSDVRGIRLQRSSFLHCPTIVFATWLMPSCSTVNFQEDKSKFLYRGGEVLQEMEASLKRSRQDKD